jgi:hypothetical protein
MTRNSVASSINAIFTYISRVSCASLRQSSAFFLSSFGVGMTIGNAFAVQAVPFAPLRRPNGCLLSIFDDPEHWRGRAEEARSIAER